MTAPTDFEAFYQAVAEKKHDLSNDSFKVALLAAANAPDAAADAVLADLTEADYTHCSSRALTTSSAGLVGGVYTLVFADLVLTASGGSVGPFRYIPIYNDTAASKNLVRYYDYGSDITLADGETFTLDLNQADGELTVGPTA